MLRRLLLSLVTISVVSILATAQTTISTSGDAEIRIAPDEVVLNVGVQTFDRVLKVAKTTNDSIIRRAIEVATLHGVPQQNLQTDYISVEPHYQDGDITRELRGYVVRKSLTIRLRNVPEFESLITDLLDNGVNVVHGIEFRTTELRKYRDQARTLAIKAAREKAEALAQAAGRSAGATLSIGDGGSGWYSPYSWWGGRGSGYSAQNVLQNTSGSETEGSLAPGQITVTAHVGITVALD